MANEHNTRWRMSIMLDGQVVYGSFFRQVIIPYHRHCRRPPRPRPHRLVRVTYTLLYKGATEADLKRWIWKNDWSNVLIWPNDRMKLGQMTERNLAKRPNGSWPNDRTNLGQTTERILAKRPNGSWPNDRMNLGQMTERIHYKKCARSIRSWKNTYLYWLTRILMRTNRRYWCRIVYASCLLVVCPSYFPSWKGTRKCQTIKRCECRFF